MPFLVGGFSKHLEEIFNNPTLSDVTIILDNDADEAGRTEAFYGHRVVLATMSDYFKTMLFGPFVEAGQREIRLNDVPYSVFKRCMRFAYFGWNRNFEEMTVDEAVQFYSLSRMLLLDVEMKGYYVSWMRKNIVKWEKDIWKLYIAAIDFSLPELTKNYFSHFTDIANECLALDSFRNVPLQLVQKIVRCKAMNCTKDDLVSAVQNWITSNNAILKDADRLQLLRRMKARKKACFKGKVLQLYGKEQRKQYQATPADLPTVDHQDSTSRLYRYHTLMEFHKCVNLSGIRFVMECNKSIDPSYAKIRSEIDILIEIAYPSSRENVLFPDSNFVNAFCKNVHLVCDFTQSDTCEANVFFAANRCCAEHKVIIRFSWSGAGIQPVFRTFGEFSNELVSGKKSIVSHLFYVDVDPDSNGNCSQCDYDDDIMSSYYSRETSETDEDAIEEEEEE